MKKNIIVWCGDAEGAQHGWVRALECPDAIVRNQWGSLQALL